MNWNIHPLVGLNELKFSMTHSEVSDVLDKFSKIGSKDTLIDGTVTEFRGMNMPVCNYKDGKLRCIDTHWSMAPLLFNDIDVFSLESKKLLAFLEEKNGGAMVLYSTVYFYNIGLSASNYIDKKNNIFEYLSEDEDERGIGMFELGAFDDLIPDGQSISFRSE